MSILFSKFGDNIPWLGSEGNVCQSAGVRVQARHWELAWVIWNIVLGALSLCCVIWKLFVH